MGDKVSRASCLCPKCSDEQFDPSECMFCARKIKGKGNLRSTSGARMCVGCLKEAMKLLAEIIEKEAS